MGESMNKRLNFGGDPDPWRSGSRIRIRIGIRIAALVRRALAEWSAIITQKPAEYEAVTSVSDAGHTDGARSSFCWSLFHVVSKSAGRG